MAAYLVYIREKILNQSELDKYEQESGKIKVENAQAPLSFYGNVEVLEGDSIDGVVILPFDSMQEAKKAYENPEYQKAMKHRLKGANYRVFITDGVK